MKLFKDNFKAICAVLCTALLAISIVNYSPREVSAQGYSGQLAVSQPNYSYAPMVFTATAQTKTQVLGGCSTATISISGTALTTVTWQIFASNDGGTNYYAIPQSTGAFTSNVLTVTTGAATTTTAATLYYANLSGFTIFKIVTSGTFTATNVTAKVVCSANKGLV